MAIKDDIELEVVKSIIRLMNIKPFYGHVVQQLTKHYIEDGKEPSTAAVGKNEKEKTIKLYINKGYISKLIKENSTGKSFVVSVLEHEILHIVFGHLFVKFADHTRGNVAVDLVVNQYIDPVHDNWMTIKKYELPEGKSCLWYYDQLKDNENYKKDLARGAFGEKGVYSYMKDAHSKWDGVSNDPTSQDILKDMISKAKETCNGYGDIHGDVKEFLDEYLKFEKAKVSWNRILRLFVASSAESILGQTIMRESKRYGTRPGNKQIEILNIAVTIDTSGSISTEDLTEFFREINAIRKNDVSITLIEADCAICNVSKFNGKFSGQVHGRGGTDLEPALKYVDEKKRFDAHIYFTDFEAPRIEKRYRTPVLWVLTSDMDKEHHPYAWGRKVNIRNGRPV